MKHLLTLSALIPSLVFGQSLTTTDPQERTVLLEDFTGVNCGYCPEGHVIAADLSAANPGRVSTVGVHAGVFATPSGTQPDFRTPEGTAIDAFYQISGYPAGVISRHQFSTGYEQGRGAWEQTVNEVLGMQSPVNLGVESSYDAEAQELTVHVQLYYTGDSPGAEDRIGVLVTENHIVGWQTDYGPAGNHASYDHTHVLRDYLTDIWGDAVGAAVSPGTWLDRTFTIAVPSTWNIANCDVVAFVGEYQSDVYQARTIKADGGTTLVIGSLAGDPAPFRGGVTGTPNDFSMNMTNALNADEEYVVALVAQSAPAAWGLSLTVNGNDAGATTSVTVANAGSAAIVAHVTPDATPGIGNYLLTISSSTNPNAPLLQQDIHVISNVHDLVVTNPQAEQWEALYEASLVQANETYRARTSRTYFTRFGEANALGDVLNVYVNASWTFPSLLDDEVAALSAFMDAGGNLMIAGQDIGWDQSGADGSYGTAATQAFYTNYMLADFVADGSSTNTPANFVDDDLVFGSLANSNIANVFAGNTYPEEFTPIDPAVPVLKYGTTTKVGGLRAQTANHKVVYFGVGPEQMASGDVGRMMIQLSHDWFYGIVGIEEFDAMTGNLGQAYPVPADTRLTIPVLALKAAATLDVMDATGRMVSRTNVAPGANRIDVDTQRLSNGMYSFRLSTANDHGTARTFIVAH